MTQHRPRNALYLLPNSFTTAALFFGFYAILQAIAGDWQQAAIGVFVATILDSCDGRVARWTNTESTFGVEYDSLADTVSFGVAPAIILHQWSLNNLDKIGIGVAFCYCAATALRLARFNCQVGKVDRRYFIGIPSPAAALLVVSFVATIDSFNIDISPLIVAFISLLAAFSMVSGIRFHNISGIHLRTRTPFRTGVLLLTLGAILFNILAYNFMLAVLTILSSYLLSGYGLALWAFIKRRRLSNDPDIPETCNDDENKG